MEDLLYKNTFLYHPSQRLKYSITPGEDWGPALNKHRLEAGYPPIESGEEIGSKMDNPPAYNDIFNKNHITKV